jgi:hypothetical protein
MARLIVGLDFPPRVSLARRPPHLRLGKSGGRSLFAASSPQHIPPSLVTPQVPARTLQICVRLLPNLARHILRLGRAGADHAMAITVQVVRDALEKLLEFGIVLLDLLGIRFLDHRLRFPKLVLQLLNLKTALLRLRAFPEQIEDSVDSGRDRVEHMSLQCVLNRAIRGPGRGEQAIRQDRLLPATSILRRSELLMQARGNTRNILSANALFLCVCHPGLPQQDLSDLMAQYLAGTRVFCVRICL